MHRPKPAVRIGFLGRLLTGGLAAALLAAGTHAATPIRLTLAEQDGLARRDEPVTFAVPIPQGELQSADCVRLLRDGREVPAQFRATGVWRPADSVRWLLVDLQATLAARSVQDYVLEYGEGVSPEARPDKGLRIEESDDAFTVHTGAAVFRVSKTTFSLFDEVRLADGTPLVEAPPAGKPRYGAWLRRLKAMVTRPIPGKDNKGNSHLISVACSDKAVLEDYTLRFTTDREFEITGARSGPAGKGAYLTDFTGRDGLVSIARGSWLNYHYPKQGDVYTFRTVPAGASAASEGVFETVLLERGPLRSVVRVKGSFGPAAAPAPEYTAWYHFYAGSGRVKLVFTIENNNHGGRTPDGNARNADIGGANCVFFDEMALVLPLSLGESPYARIGGSAAMTTFTAALDQPLELYQDSSGGPRWDRYAGAPFHPRPNSYVTIPGCQVSKGGHVFRRGDRAPGWMDVTDRAKGVTVGVRDFWQNYPKALAADPGGAIEVGLFPGRYAGDFALRSGEHKTHEVWFDFHGQPAATPVVEAEGQAFSSPLRLEASPEWYARTKAIGRLHPFGPTDYRAYEARNLSTIGLALPLGDALTPGPSAASGRGEKVVPSLLWRIDEHEFYGWMDYGDVPIDFETPSGQWGMKYDMEFHMAQQWARTLRPEWWRLFAAAARHTADIDIHHQPHYPGLHFVKGGTWAHSLHGEPGHTNPHRNRNHFTKDLAFAARGTAAYYYLTGDWPSRDACLAVAENALAEYMSPQEAPDPGKCNRMGWRGDACTLNRLLEGYLLSGDEKYLARARWQVASCAFDGLPLRHGPVSLWSSAFYMMALARYVEMFPDDAAARGYLLAHLETLRKSIDPKHGIYYTITPQPDGSVKGEGSCSHYNIMAADALATGYAMTRDRKYLDAARFCFEYGVKNACWEDGPPTYQQVHSANGAMHGNVFMAVEAESRARAGQGKQP